MGRGRVLWAALVVALVAAIAPPSAATGPTLRLVVSGGTGGFKTAAAIPALGISVIEVPVAGADGVAARLRAGGAVVEPDVRVHAAETTPDDPRWSSQWGPRAVGAPRAWDTTRGDDAIVVAIVDTGVDAHHPDLDHAVRGGIDLVNGDDDASDDNGHGTLVAGVVAAEGDNGEGVAGYCWECSVLPVKVLDAEGNGDASTVAEGIVAAVDAGASVVNLSLSSASTSFALASAARYAADRDVAIVAAAGNEGLVTPHYPAALPGVIGVTASDEHDQVFEWANRGRWANVAAPGCHQTTALGGGYEELCGTSSSAPAVAGVVALARSAAPDADVEAIRRALYSSAVTIERDHVAAGRIVADRTVRSAMRPPPDVPAQTAGVLSSPRGVRAVAIPGGARVTWMPPETTAGAVAEYVVTTQSERAEHIVGGDTFSVDVTGLVDGLSYRFVVMARTAAGWSPPSDPSGPVTPTRESFVRVAGRTRVQTAVAVSQRAFGRAGTAVLVRGDRPHDALVAGPLAGRVGGPLLLTGGGLELEVGGELRRLGVTTVHLVGALANAGSELDRQLEAWGVTNVVRTVGEDAFETAALVAEMLGSSSAYVVDRGRWPDALAAAAIASAQGRPILFVDGATVPPSTGRALRSLRIAAAVVVGGTAALPDSVLATLSDVNGDGVEDVAVTRVAGSNRYDTARRMADVAVRSGVDGTRVWIASGESWPDALSTGAALAALGGVLLLAHPRDLGASEATVTWLRSVAAGLVGVVVVGGTGSITEGASRQVQALVES